MKKEQEQEKEQEKQGKLKAPKTYIAIYEASLKIKEPNY